MMPDCQPSYGLEELATSAISRLAVEYNRRAARRVIHALQRIPASGIFGDDYRFKTLWDDLCHDAQTGPYWDDDDAWDSVLNGLLEAEVDKLTPAEYEMLWLAALPDFEDLRVAPRDSAVIKEEFRVALMMVAGERNLSRFEIE